MAITETDSVFGLFYSLSHWFVFKTIFFCRELSDYCVTCFCILLCFFLLFSSPRSVQLCDDLLITNAENFYVISDPDVFHMHAVISNSRLEMVQYQRNIKVNLVECNNLWSKKGVQTWNQKSTARLSAFDTATAASTKLFFARARAREKNYKTKCNKFKKIYNNPPTSNKTINENKK